MQQYEQARYNTCMYSHGQMKRDQDNINQNT